MITSQYQTHPKLKYFNEFIIKKDPREDYKLIKNIGSGTYGEVYRAANRKSGVHAAIKIVKVDIKDDVKAIAQEIHTLRDCHHPNIVEYYGSYLRKNKLWICMEFCGGFSMQDIYTNIRRSLEENCIAFVTRETLKGLAYMHKQGKIHRDIKGANILLTEDGLVKIADFGVAAQITETIQKRSSFIGTPYWMAPEVAAVERKGGYDEKCDIWAVGITAIEYAELQPPMFDLHPMKALHLLSLRSYKPPVLQNRYKWSSKFQSFLKICLNKNEKRRPDAETMLKNEFLTSTNLGVQLTQKLLQLNKNPGRVPLVPNDDDEEDEFEGLATLGRDSNNQENKNQAKNISNHQDKADNKVPKLTPLEKIRSTRRDLKFPFGEDIEMKISALNDDTGAPICQPEEMFTLALSNQNQPISSPDSTPTTTTTNSSHPFEFDPLFTPTNSQQKDNQNSNHISFSVTLQPPIRNEQVEQFNAYNDTSEDKSSDISNESTENPPTPPPKRSTQPPPVPPLPTNKKQCHNKSFSNNSSSGGSSSSNGNNSNKSAKSSKLIKDYKPSNHKPLRKMSANDLLELTKESNKSKSKRSSEFEPTSDSLSDLQTPTRPPAPLPSFDSSLLPPPLPPHKTRSTSSPTPPNNSINNKVPTTDESSSSESSSNQIRKQSTKQKPSNENQDLTENQEESLLDQSRKKAVGQGLPPTPRVPMGACFSLIFEGCPLKVNASATWVNPATDSQIIIFGTNEGIYYLALDDLVDGTLNLLFPKPCKWLYIVRNTMMSLSGHIPQLYTHNLESMFTALLNSSKMKFTKFFKNKMPTTKIRDTRGCLLVSVTRNPYNGAKYLCAALATNEILVMEWFNPVSTFLEVRRVCTAPDCHLPTPLLNFDLLIFQKSPLPNICLGVYPIKSSSSNNNYKFHLLDLNAPQNSMDTKIDFPNNITAIVDCTPPQGEPLVVNKVIQLEFKTVLIAFENSVVITDLKGRLKSAGDKISEIPFPNGAESIVYLSDSIFAFNQHGFTAKNFNGHLTQEIYDNNNIYRLIGSDKNIVVEKRPRDKPMDDSNLYVLAGHTDSSNIINKF